MFALHWFLEPVSTVIGLSTSLPKQFRWKMLCKNNFYNRFQFDRRPILEAEPISESFVSKTDSLNRFLFPNLLVEPVLIVTGIYSLP